MVGGGMQKGRIYNVITQPQLPITHPGHYRPINHPYLWGKGPPRHRPGASSGAAGGCRSESAQGPDFLPQALEPPSHA